ncbi:MAG: homoserine O-succinyltransferase [Luteimonas sp.]
MSFVDSARQHSSSESLFDHARGKSADSRFATPACLDDAVRGDIAMALPMRHAGVRDVRIRYECAGPVDAPVVLVAGGISADRHVVSSARYPQRGWWQVQSGYGLDTTAVCILAIDWLGADGALDAPIDPADQADAIAAVLDALGIARIAAFVGCSYGAMVGLHFAASHSERLHRLVAISGTHRSHPYASAWRALQRQTVALGQLQCDAAQGLALARQWAMLSYRTPEEFDERFVAAPVVAHDRVRVAAEEYLEACGARYAAQTSPTAFLRLSESIDLHVIEPERVRVPTTVVAVLEDRLVPAEDAFALVERLPQGKLKVLRSRYGHDAFLKETAAIGDVLTAELSCVEGVA